MGTYTYTDYKHDALMKCSVHFPYVYRNALELKAGLILSIVNGASP